MLAWKNLRRKSTRTLLSMFGVSIGIASIVAFISMGQGFKHGLNTYMKSTDADLLAFNRNALSLEFSRIDESDLSKLSSLKDTTSAPLVSEISRGTFYVIKRSPALMLFGRETGRRVMDKFRKGMVEGRIMENPDEIMLGTMAAKRLEKKVGDTFELFKERDQKVVGKIVGIFHSNILWEDNNAIVHYTVPQRALKMPHAVSLVFIHVPDRTRIEEVQVRIEQELPHLLVVQPEKFSDSFDQMKYVDWFVWVISIISVIVGALGVLNTMMMSVAERIREIGTLRAVGWSKQSVVRLIVMEGLAISLVGGTVGLALGCVGAEIIMSLDPERVLVAHYTWDTFVKAIAVAIGVGFVGSLYPAWQASKLSPVEALRYE